MDEETSLSMGIDYEAEKIENLLKESHRLRLETGLNEPSSDNYVLIQALRMYVRSKERTLRSYARRTRIEAIKKVRLEKEMEKIRKEIGVKNKGDKNGME